MIPGLLRHVKLPFAFPEVPLVAIHGQMLDYVRECFDRDGEVPPTWLVQIPGRLVWIATPWEDDREKEKSVFVIEEMLEQLGGLSYSFACEAWVSVYEKDEVGEDGGHVKPKDRPKEKRDDIVFVSSFARGGQHFTSRFLVSVRDDLPPLLGPRQDESGYDHMEGLLFNLFDRKLRRVEK